MGEFILPSNSGLPLIDNIDLAGLSADYDFDKSFRDYSEMQFEFMARITNPTTDGASNRSVVFYDISTGFVVQSENQRIASIGASLISVNAAASLAVNSVPYTNVGFTSRYGLTRIVINVVEFPDIANMYMFDAKYWGARINTIEQVYQTLFYGVIDSTVQVWDRTSFLLNNTNETIQQGYLKFRGK